MAQGPLIPGMREFDTPRRGGPGWVLWVVIAIGVVVVLVVGAGFVGGVGPLRTLGLSTTTLEPVRYRPTTVDTVIQIGVAMPPTGLCRDDEIAVVAFERGARIEIEASVTRPRRADCASEAMAGDMVWADVSLTAPLADRTVIRLPDREPLPRETATT